MKFKNIAATLLVAAPLLAGASPLTLFAGKNISLEQNTQVTGDVGAKGNVDAKINSQVKGNVSSGGKVTLEQNAKITGNATAADTVEVKINAKVDGTVSNKTSTPGLNTLPATTNFTAGTKAYALNAYTSGTLSQGAYGKVNIGYESALTLSAGSYYFESLVTSANTKFIFDLSGGDINLFINGNVNIGSNFDFVMLNGTANDIYTETKGNWEQGAWGEWFGTLYASGANSNLHFNQGNKIGGIFMASKNIQLDVDTIVTSMPSEAAKVPAPGSIALMGIGLLALAVFRRRKAA